MIEHRKSYCEVVCLIVLLTGCLSLAPRVNGQGLTNQTNIFIPGGLDVYLDGDFVNEGFIQNQGNFF